MKKYYGCTHTRKVYHLEETDPAIEGGMLIELKERPICVQPGNVAAHTGRCHYSHKHGCWVTDAYQSPKDFDPMDGHTAYNEIYRYGPEIRHFEVFKGAGNAIREALSDYISVLTYSESGAIEAIGNSDNYILQLPSMESEDTEYKFTLMVDGALHPEDRHHIIRTVTNDIIEAEKAERARR